MTNKILDDYGRRSLNLWTPKVVEVLPEHFRTEYPQLIELLEAYHNYLDSDGNINDDLMQILRVKDVEGVSLKFLDYLIREVGSGLSSSTFDNPREMAKLFPDFYRYKGSVFSAKLFFRALYGEEVEVSYPKDNVFIVGESRIGPESLRYIQNGALYQTLSILIKSSRPISQWRDLYKQLVHPAGFYLGGEVLIEGIVDLNLGLMPTAIPDSSANQISLSTDVGAIIFSTPFEPMMGYYDGPGDSADRRIDLERDMSAFGGDSLGLFTAQYPSLLAFQTANPPNFDDSNSITWSNDYETFDRAQIEPDSFVATALGGWIMEDGKWLDGGNWDDSALWIDSALATANWILETGFWNDAGVYRVAAVWKDS